MNTSSSSSRPPAPVASPAPTRLIVHAKSKVLEISFADQRTFQLSFEFLRVWSPSAEVRGHGPGQEVLQVGKRAVDISGIEPVGHYAIQPYFSDGHNTGIFSWDYLYWLGSHHEQLWADYLQRLDAAGASRGEATEAGADDDDFSGFRAVEYRK